MYLIRYGETPAWERYYYTQGLRLKLRTALRAACFFLLFLFLLLNANAQQNDNGSARISNTSENKNDAAIDSVLSPNMPVPHLYRVNYWVSGGFSILATLGDAYAIPHILHAKKQLTDEEIASLNTNVFNGIDRWALQQDPSKRDAYYRVSDIMLPAIMVSAASLAFDKKIRKDWQRVLMMYYEMHAATFTTYNFSFFGPAFQNKLRPIVYYTEMPIDERKGGNQRNSMFSGHVANATASTFFMAKVYSDYHPEIGKKKYLLFALASVPPLVEGYLRVKALAHFPSDVLVGYAIGAVAGISIPALHRYRNHNINIGLAAVPSGAGLRIAWTPGEKQHNLLGTFTGMLQAPDNE
jgi:hypothetical protein